MFRMKVVVKPVSCTLPSTPRSTSMGQDERNAATPKPKPELTSLGDASGEARPKTPACRA